MVAVDLAVLAVAVGGLVWLWRRRSAGMLLLVLAVAAGGCGSDAPHREADVAFAFGSTGGGDGEFIYPRAITRGAGETFYVVDKTGRIQQFSRKGERLGGQPGRHQQVLLPPLTVRMRVPVRIDKGDG